MIHVTGANLTDGLPRELDRRRHRGMRGYAGQPAQLVRAEAQDVVEARIGAAEVEGGVELTLTPQHAGRQLIREPAVTLREPGEVAVASVGQGCSGAYRAENLECRATRGSSGPPRPPGCFLNPACLGWGREVGGASRDRCQPHRVRHSDGILRCSDRRIHQNPVDALLHGHARIGCRPDAGIDDHRNPEPSLDCPHAQRIEQPESAADRRRQRHDRGTAGILEPQRGDEILVRVGKNFESFLHEHLGGLEQALHVRHERLFVANDFELDEVVEPRFARQSCVTDRVGGGVTTGRVGKQKDALRVEEVKDTRFFGAVEVHPAHGDRHDFRA